MSYGPKPKSLTVRFWPKVAISGPDSCWEWRGARRKPGPPHYGVGFIHSGITGKFIAAPRAAWMVTHGDIPAGMCVCHSCDNRGCCNPAHLFLGTRTVNNQDRQAKGRTHSKLSQAQVTELRRNRKEGVSVRLLMKDYQISQAHVYRILSGVRSGVVRQKTSLDVKLTDEQVLEIRQRYVDEKITQFQLAREYGVKQPQISRILLRRSWPHI